jgi:carbamoyltransferase
MTNILGISAFYHDSAAALAVDGRIVAAAQEERFTRRKHDDRFPANAVRYCLAAAGLTIDDLDHVAFYDKPLLKFDRLIETYLAFAPRGLQSFRRAMPIWLRKKLHTRSLLREELGLPRRKQVIFLEHHQSHAASAFFPSPFDEAAILTIDGVGEWTTASFGKGRGNRFELHRHLTFPHSLGMLYSAFTYYCGFKVNSGEYKLMGLAPYGDPVYADRILRDLIHLKSDGSFWLDMDYFNYCQGLTMTGERFHRLFGGPPREPESPVLQRHMDLAASIQSVTETVMMRIIGTVYEETKVRNLVMAGGVALNCVANSRILREGPFEGIWIQPAAGDAGGALGSALFVWHQLLGNERVASPLDMQFGSFLGPEFSNGEIRSFLDRIGVTYEFFAEDGELLERTVDALGCGQVVGWFQGRMEFGPRALGARSILGDARSARMQSIMNLKVKFRESFRPFAPAVLREHADEWFDLPRKQESPYMLLVAPVRDHRRVEIPASDLAMMEHDEDLRKRVNVVRSSIPAVTHVDYTARLQTVDRERNPKFHALLSAFHRRTGCPVLVNTSFNVRGEPIVCTPEDAFRCFSATDMDVLVLGNFVVRKSDSDASVTATREEHLARFQLD